MDVAEEIIARLDNLRFLGIWTALGILALVVRAFTRKDRP